MKWRIAHRRVNGIELPIYPDSKPELPDRKLDEINIDDKLITSNGTYFKVSKTCIEKVQTIGSGFNSNRYSDIYYREV